MPAVRPGYLTEIPSTTFDFGSSDTTAIKLLYPNSPHYNNYKDEDVRNAFQNPPELNNGVINDGGYMFGEVAVDYRDTPNLAEVEVGGAGKPATPFGPNIASPRQGLDPKSIPEEGVEATLRQQSTSPGYGKGSNFTSPSATKTQRRLIGQNIGLGSGGNNFSPDQD